VEVVVFQDPGTDHTPDSIFPNNWVSFHEDGRVVLYPMQAHNRRLERKISLVEALKEQHGYRTGQILDLSYFEALDKFLEGTGSMVLDRENKIAYACLSPRTHPEVLDTFCELMGYAPFAFEATDTKGVPVYHTNVLMSVGNKIAIVCLEALSNSLESRALVRQLEKTNKLVIPITLAQMNNFAGNMLHVQTLVGEPLLVMSEQGYKSLHEDQVALIESVTNVLHTNLAHIERYGGGSARCMMAEVFVPKG